VFLLWKIKAESRESKYDKRRARSGRTRGERELPNMGINDCHYYCYSIWYSILKLSFQL
jgi:hypothetical protein